MPLRKIVDGELIDMSPEEEAAFLASQVPDLNAAKDARKNEVDSLRDAKLAAGFPFMGKVIQFDPRSEAKITGGHALARDARDGLIPWPADFRWRTADNTFLPLTMEQMLQLGQTAAGIADAMLKRGWAHKDAIEAMTEPAAVQAYDITAGWPL
jgi:uncharacterized protein DUF4376